MTIRVTISVPEREKHGVFVQTSVTAQRDEEVKPGESKDFHVWQDCYLTVVEHAVHF